MGTVNRSGLMVQNMKVSGSATRPMVMANFNMPMEMFMRGNGKTTKLMVMEVISMQMVLPMLESGRMTSNTEEV